MTEIEPVHRTVKGFHRPAEVLEVAKDSGDAAKSRHRRVVRMERHPQTDFLADRKDPFQVPAVVLPDFAFGVLAVRRRARPDGIAAAVAGRDRLGSLHPERRCLCPSSYRGISGGAPDSAWHEVVSEVGNAGPRDVPDGADHVGKLPLASRLAQHDAVIEVPRHVLDRDQAEFRALRLRDQAGQILVFPSRFSRQNRCIHLEVIAAALLDKPQPRLRDFLELPEAYSHR